MMFNLHKAAMDTRIEMNEDGSGCLIHVTGRREFTKEQHDEAHKIYDMTSIKERWEFDQEHMRALFVSALCSITHRDEMASWAKASDDNNSNVKGGK